METQDFNGKQHVFFSTSILKNKKSNSGAFFNIDTLEHLYCLVMKNLRESESSNAPKETINELNKKRRTLLLQIRRAQKLFCNGRRLPLGVSSMPLNKRKAKIGHYTILG